jgi:hypothetical protein
MRYDEEFYVIKKKFLILKKYSHANLGENAEEVQVGRTGIWGACDVPQVFVCVRVSVCVYLERMRRSTGVCIHM